MLKFSIYSDCYDENIGLYFQKYFTNFESPKSLFRSPKFETLTTARFKVGFTMAHLKSAKATRLGGFALKTIKVNTF